jgi:hypothetical protein
MKKPALIKTTVRLFPDKKSAAATTRTTIKGHATGLLYYSPLKSKDNLLSRILKKRSTLSASCIAILEKASEARRLFLAVWHDRKY